MVGVGFVKCSKSIIAIIVSKIARRCSYSSRTRWNIGAMRILMTDVLGDTGKGIVVEGIFLGNGQFSRKIPTWGF